MDAEIPLSALEGFRYYESPFAEFVQGVSVVGISALARDDHFQWHRFRELYERTGDTSYLDRMRSVVTSDNPPFAEVEETEYVESDEWPIGVRIVFFVLLFMVVIIGSHIVFPA